MATQPKNATQIKAVLQEQLESKARHTEGLVSPTGDVTEHWCPPPEDGAENGPRSGDTPVAWINGAPRVVKKYEDQGYMMLRDVCRADRRDDLHEQWKAAIYARIAKGMPIRGDVGELYPPTVMELRSRALAGGNKEGKAFVIGQGITDDPAAQRRTRVADFLASAGVGDPRLTPEPPKKGKGAQGATDVP